MPFLSCFLVRSFILIMMGLPILVSSQTSFAAGFSYADCPKINGRFKQDRSEGITEISTSRADDGTIEFSYRGRKLIVDGDSHNSNGKTYTASCDKGVLSIKGLSPSDEKPYTWEFSDWGVSSEGKDHFNLTYMFDAGYAKASLTLVNLDSIRKMPKHRREDCPKYDGVYVADRGPNQGTPKTIATEIVDGETIFTFGSMSVLADGRPHILNGTTQNYLAVCTNGGDVRVKIYGEGEVLFSMTFEHPSNPDGNIGMWDYRFQPNSAVWRITMVNNNR